MASQFEQLTTRLDHLEKLLMQVIHMMGPRLDQDSLRAGIEEEGLDFLDADEGIWEHGPLEDSREEPVFPDEEPRTRVPYKTNDGSEAFVAWDSLDKDMKAVIEIARTMSDPWQLYESPSGEMRIAVSGQVEAAFRSHKLGNRTGK